MGLLSLPEHLPEPDRRPVDLLVALGVGLRSDGTPGPPTTAVAERTANLLEHNLARVALLSGGYRQAGISEAEAMRTILIGRSITTPIFIDCSPNHVRGTPFQPPSAERIFHTKLKTNPKHILLVAHSMHLPRAQWLFRRFFSKIEFYWAGAGEIYDPCSSQRRLHGPRRFALWNLMAWGHHRLFVR